MNPWLRERLLEFSHLTGQLNYGRDIVRDWAVAHLATVSSRPRVLDLGLGSGTDLLNIRSAFGKPVDLFGLESHPPNIEAARQNGIQTWDFDLERGRFPVDEGTLDVVVANQILEHTKELFWIFSEVFRVLKPGGAFIIGVPNLASLHNRAALLLGMQPFSMEILGPHVRGFVRGSFVEFIERDGYFKVLGVRGSNCYPLPPFLSKPVVRLFPGVAVGNFYSVRRQDRPGRFADILKTVFLETNFYTGESA
ncbi:MAG: methyltransferase domain-containing protein [Verrucomicrobia bacterium]|nr:methyltransferase domain-containing protein [Verrucomicrobiota bacterium]